MPSVEELEAALAEARAAELEVQSTPGFEPPLPVEARSSDVWSKQAAERTKGYDFVVPSGQKCRLRRVTPEMLLPLGILDRVTRLEGLAQTLVDKAEGAPPQADKMPSREELALLLETVNLLVPLAVIEPFVYGENYEDPVPEGAILVSDIDLEDRIAIMNRALAGIAKLDRFRHA